MQLFVINCGVCEYQSLWDVQKKALDARVEQIIPDVLLITEHPHVYTLGKTADPNHLVASKDYLSDKKIDVVKIDRGGGITYHGPGQLVVYPIISLENFGRDITKYLRMLESSIIDMLKEFGIDARHDPDYTGVWVAENKIASIGIKVRKWVTMHGAAINVSTNLSYFDGIIACGIFHKGMTSISQLLHSEVALTQVAESFVRSFCNQFSFYPENISFQQLQTLIEPVQESA